MHAKKILVEAQKEQNRTLSQKHTIERELVTLNERIQTFVYEIKDQNERIAQNTEELY